MDSAGRYVGIQKSNRKARRYSRCVVRLPILGLISADVEEDPERDGIMQYVIYILDSEVADKIGMCSSCCSTVISTGVSCRDPLP